MWKWLQKNVARPNSSQNAANPPITATKSPPPEGLQGFWIRKLSANLLLFHNYGVDLTVAQNEFNVKPSDILWSSQSLRWAKAYHDLRSEPDPPVRLHQNNLLLSSPHYSKTSHFAEDIAVWLNHFEWNENRPFTAQQATTRKPLEDGFFSCVRILAEGWPSSSDSGLRWKRYNEKFDNIIDCLAAYAWEELNRIGGPVCEPFLHERYSGLPPECLQHPVFALLDFPCFDNGSVMTTFSGSVWSENEIRFWSRPTLYATFVVLLALGMTLSAIRGERKADLSLPIQNTEKANSP